MIVTGTKQTCPDCGAPVLLTEDESAVLDFAPPWTRLHRCGQASPPDEQTAPDETADGNEDA